MKAADDGERPCLLPQDYAEECRSCKAMRRRWRGVSSGGCGRSSGRIGNRCSPRRTPSGARLARPVTRPQDGAACVQTQYPDMTSIVEADLRQLEMCSRCTGTSIRHRHNEMAKEIGDPRPRGARLPAQAKHAPLSDIWPCRGSSGARHAAGTVDGAAVDDGLARRRQTARLKQQPNPRATYRQRFKAWWIPFSRFGVIHGDAHLAIYGVRHGRRPRGARHDRRRAPARVAARGRSRCPWAATSSRCCSSARERPGRGRARGRPGARRAARPSARGGACHPVRRHGVALATGGVHTRTSCCATPTSDYRPSRPGGRAARSSRRACTTPSSRGMRSSTTCARRSRRGRSSRLPALVDSARPHWAVEALRAASPLAAPADLIDSRRRRT